MVLAVGVQATSELEVLGLEHGPERGRRLLGAVPPGTGGTRLIGVQVAISDAHEGLKAAVAAVLHGAAWQRCRVHLVRNALALVLKAAAPMVAATIRTVFVQPEAPSARKQWRRVADGFRPCFPRLAVLRDTAEADVLAPLAFPAEHWRQCRSTNPLERVNKAIKRHADVVGSFPNDAAVVRPGRDGAGRAARRVAGRPPLLQCRVPGQAHPTRGSASARSELDGPAGLIYPLDRTRTAS